MKFTIFIFIITLTAHHAICQSGPNPTLVGSIDEYSYTSEVIYPSYYWEMSGGVELSKTLIGNEYRITIQWFSSGSHYLMLVDNSTSTIITQTFITVNPCTAPLAAASNQTITSGQTTSITISNPNNISGTTFSWTANASNVTGASAGSGTTIAQTLTSTSKSASVTYTITPVANGCSGPPIAIVVTVALQNNYNWIKEATVLVEGKLTKAAVDASLIQSGEKNINWTYFDGLGRLMQSINVQGSPNKKDMVQPAAYDEFGREVYKYLPYASSEDNGYYKLDALADPSTTEVEPLNIYRSGKHYEFYQTEEKVAQDDFPYSERVFEPSPLNRVLKQGTPGSPWQPDASSTDRTIKNAYEANAVDEVLMWRYSYPTISYPLGVVSMTSESTPTTPNYYAANELYKNKTKDEEGHEVIEYVDKEGRTVLKRVQATGSSAINDTNYASTYYIYDDFGSLVCVIPPEATKRLQSEFYQSGASLSTKHEFLERWSFRYAYDELRRMKIKQVPGADSVSMVYDERNRLVLTQDGNQRLQNKWTFTKYDQLNRPIITGIYTHPSSATSKEMREEISTADFFETYIGAESPHGYTDNLFPQNGLVLTVTYYDSYDFRNDLIGGSTFNFKNNDIADQEAAATSKVIGLVTGTKVNVLNAPDYLWEVTYYDSKYRAIQNIASNYRGGTDLTTSVIDFAGKVFRTKTTTMEPSKPDVEVHRWFVYDHAARLKETHHKIIKGTQEGPEVFLSKQEYNELGQLIVKKLHRQSGTTVTPDPLVGQQGVVYANDIVLTQYDPQVVAYVAKNSITIQPGFSIPAGGTFVARLGYSQEDADAYNALHEFAQAVDFRYNIRGWLDNINDVDEIESGDLFSMDLNYNNPIANGGPQQFNGNISQARWKGPDGEKKSYGYSYDPMNRLTKGLFFSAGKDGRFNEKIGDETHPDKPAYDLNGNILNLFRNGKTGELPSGEVTYGEMDELEYNSYTGNQLLGVIDHKVDTAGFKDDADTNDDYSYDHNGNMEMDKNKSLNEGSIDYNHLNLPELVTKSPTEYVQYIYDATGRKLKQIAVEGTTKTTDYAGEFIYENGALQFINHEEGRVIMTDASPEYQYHLKDHLGNVRTTFTTKEETEAPVGTLETANENEERAKFLKYDDVRKVNETLFDHTNAGTTKYAMRLTGTSKETYGLARSISVMPGDKVKAEVFAKYVDVSQSDVTTALQNLIAQIVAGTTGPGVVVDGGAYGTPGAGTIPYTSFLDKSNEGEGPPKAYLNWLVFDRDYNPIISKSGYKRIGTAARENGQLLPEGAAHELLQSPEIEITEAGFVYIYLSNEEQGDEVYFDDFEVEHVKSPIVQSDDYYPFGLSFNSYSREQSVKQNYLFNGKEIQDELGLNWSDYGSRMYMADLGRWGVIDPLSTKGYDISPFSYALNNPLNYVDYGGKFPLPVLYLVYEGLAYAFTATAAMYVVTNHDKLSTGIYFGGGSSILEARGKAQDPYWARYVWKNNRGVALDVGQPMGNDMKPKPNPNSNDNRPGTSFNKAAIGFLTLAALSNYQKFKDQITHARKEINSTNKRINQRIDAIYERLDVLDYEENKVEYDKLVEEKAILQDLRTENQQYQKALNRAQNDLNELNKQHLHQQDATRRENQNYSPEFLKWWYTKKGD